MKILYTFDDGPQCLTRSASNTTVRVVYNEDQSPLGLIDLDSCVKSITTASPEILSNLNNYDYAVYSTDYTEPGNPLVGHGMLSWINLTKNEDMNERKMIIGRVCNNILAVFSGGSKETLEVCIKLKPLSNCTQGQYLKSIQLYKQLSTFLPKDFDHPAWAKFISANNNLSKFIEQDEDTEMKDSHDPVFDIENLNVKPFNLAFDFNSSPPPISTTSVMEDYSSPHMSCDPASLHHTLSKAVKPLWTDSPTSPISMTSPVVPTDFSQPLKNGKRSLSVTSNKFLTTDTPFGQPPKTDMKPATKEPSTNAENNINCQNCGKMDFTASKRVKTQPSDGFGEEKEFILCRPCAAWFNTKRYMRPRHLWRDDEQVVKSKEKTSRRRRGFKHQDDYVGPSIAQLLALNVRPKATSQNSNVGNSTSTPSLTELENKPSEPTPLPEVTTNPAPATDTSVPDRETKNEEVEFPSTSESNQPADTSSIIKEDKGKLKQNVNNKTTKKIKVDKKPAKKSKKNPKIQRSTPVKIAPAVRTAFNPINMEHKNMEASQNISKLSEFSNETKEKMTPLTEKETEETPVETLRTPQKASGDFEFFESSSFAGSPPKWLLSSASKLMNFDLFMESPSKLFEATANFLSGKDKSPTKSKTLLSDAPAIVRKGSLETLPESSGSSSSKTLAMSSSPPMVEFFSRDSGVSDRQADTWSDSPNDEAPTVRDSPPSDPTPDLKTGSGSIVDHEEVGQVNETDVESKNIEQNAESVA